MDSIQHSRDVLAVFGGTRHHLARNNGGFQVHAAGPLRAREQQPDEPDGERESEEAEFISDVNV